MNEASKLVAETITDDSFCVVDISSIGKSHMVYPPSIKTIARAVVHFSKVKTMDNNIDLSDIPKSGPHIAKGLAILIVGRSPLWKLRARYVYRQLMNMTPSEMRAAMEQILPLLGGDDFFVCATLANYVAGIVAKPKL